MITLNQSQQKSLSLLEKFINDYDKRFFILKGSAGTGKSTIITHFLQNEKFQNHKIVFSATTNKAVSVLKQLSKIDKKVDFLTIHKLLNIKRKINKEGKEEFNIILDNRKLIKAASIFNYDIIIIDECSMLSNDIIEKLKSLRNIKGKIIFIGDPAQLPPVNEESYIFDSNISNYELTEIMRYKGKIVEMANKVRELVFNPEIKIKFKDYKCDNISINKKYDKWFSKYINQLKSIDTSQETFNLDDLPICLTYTNKRTEFINLEVRKHLFEGEIKRFMKNEIIIFNNYYKLLGNKNTYYTSQKSRIKKVEETTLYPKYKQLCDSCNINFENHTLDCGHKLCKKCKKKYGLVCSICNQEKMDILQQNRRDLILKKFDSIFIKNLKINAFKITLDNDDIIYINNDADYENLIERITKKIKNFRNKIKKGKYSYYDGLLEEIWSYFYENLIDIFADISYGYCITTHKSQGSTFKYIFVDMNDIILKNSNREESYRCLYTAITRTSEKISILL